MVTTTKVNWQGKSGRTYEYDVYPLNTTWNDVPGNYIFAKESTQRGWAPLYVGETGSLKDRLTPVSNHENWPCAKLNGATHVLAHVSNPDSRVRRAEESDLIGFYLPPCNG